ncbi:MAG TPA: S53 family peptidase [Tepidisphaeraceae bacterium]|jgi:hypothetical protein|nr:S53 family peptidase [Tepidisphaeraceae bacterium]
MCALEALEDRRLLSANPTASPALVTTSPTPGIPGYTPSQVLHAYGFDTAAQTIGAVGGDGTGQTIAIVEAYRSPTLAADVHQFDVEFGIPDAPSLKEVDENGGPSAPAANASWGLETDLDVEWAHAVAPGANIIVVEAKSAQLSDLLTAVDTARHFSDVSVVSMSWGVDEFSGETALDNFLTTPAGHQSVTFVAASGDTGTSPDVQWPAASPNVVSVGGSTLTLNTVTTASGAVETTYTGATAGISQYESPPSYQNPNPTSDGRNIPDVLYNANPVPGFSVYDSADGGWLTLGGTSAGAPQWAALVAIADEVRATTGQASLDGASQTLPAIYTFSGSDQAGSGAAGDQGAATNTSSGTANVVNGQGLTLNFAGTLGSGSLNLTTANGAPQATQVITALAATNAKAKAAPPAQTAPDATAVALSKLPRKTVHPFLLYNPANAPHVVAAPAAAPAVASSGAGLMLAYESKMTSFAASVSALTESIGASRILGSSGPAAVVEAAGAVTSNAPGADALSQAIAAVYHAFPRLGENDVVPVAEVFPADSAGARATFYIAHINVAATFGDSIAAFINECAQRRHPFVADEESPRGHIRAWAVTVGVIAVDALVLGYLASRRSKRSAGVGVDRWWDETMDGAVLDGLARLR